MKLWMAAAAVLLMARPAMAEDWRLVDGTDQSVEAVEASEIRDVASGRQFWTMTVYRPGSNGDVAYQMSRLIAHCDRQEITITFSANYRLDGTSTAGQNAYETSPVVPGSRGSIIYRTICSGVFEDKVAKPKSYVIDFARSYMEEH